MSLRELAADVGLSVQAVAGYERAGLIRPVTSAATPRYGEVAKLTLQVIIKGKRLGLSLEEIERLLPRTATTSRSSPREEDVAPPKDAFACDDEADCD